ncbi:hypothetical protein D3C73_1352640 [compost metagenome]
MAVLPARALGREAFVTAREIAGHQGVGAKQRRLAATTEIQAHFQVFDDVTTGQRDQGQVAPDERHAGAHQLAGQTQSGPA